MTCKENNVCEPCYKECPAYLNEASPEGRGPTNAATSKANDVKQKDAVLSGIDATLAERGSRYGRFVDHARTTQSLKTALYLGTKWAELEDDQKEALEMIAHKIGRILEGDPNYHDSWHDIVGYAKLVADRLLDGTEV